jgi:multidrug transporter EmrE-like cation transporter
MRLWIQEKMPMTSFVWSILLLAMIFYGVGEYCCKCFANNGRYTNMVVALIFYSFNTLLFLSCLSKFNSLTILGTIWNLGYLLITLALGLFVFGEAITMKQEIGIIFGAIAVVLLS